MINDGDRLCLGLSGGKDSLTLLHALHWLQARADTLQHCSRHGRSNDAIVRSVALDSLHEVTRH